MRSYNSWFNIDHYHKIQIDRATRSRNIVHFERQMRSFKNNVALLHSSLFYLFEHDEHVRHVEGYYVFNYPCDEPQNDQNITDLRLPFTVLTFGHSLRAISFYLSTYLIMWITLKFKMIYNVSWTTGIEPIKTIFSLSFHPILCGKLIFPFVRNQIECAINNFMHTQKTRRKQKNKKFALIKCVSTT